MMMSMQDRIAYLLLGDDKMKAGAAWLLGRIEREQEGREANDRALKAYLESRYVHFLACVETEQDKMIRVWCEENMGAKAARAFSSWVQA